MLIAFGLLLCTIIMHGSFGYLTCYVVGTRWQAAYRLYEYMLLWLGVFLGFCSSIVVWHSIFVFLFLSISGYATWDEMENTLGVILILSIPTIVVYLAIWCSPQSLGTYERSLMPDFLRSKWRSLNIVLKFMLGILGIVVLGPGPFICLVGMNLGILHGENDRECLK